MLRRKKVHLGKTLKLHTVILSLSLFPLTACSMFEGLNPVGKEPVITAPFAPAPTIGMPNVKNIPTAIPNTEPEHTTTASLWRSGPESLFGDRRARNIGDILTVMIEIDDRAELNNKTERKREGDDTLSISSLYGIDNIASKILPSELELNPAIGTESETTTKGDGKINRREKIELKIAAVVTDILPNGNMVIKGSQEVRVNYELRDLQMSGIVRPHDISRKNTIGYEKIAEARISYGGRGQLYNLQQPRIGQQIVDRVSPF
jgi:flagellar L-ring protein precursor FlgH